MGCCTETPIGIAKLKSILQGWSNIIWSSEKVRRIAHGRIEICVECDQNNKNFCIDCGCWIPAMARSLEEHCKKWND